MRDVERKAFLARCDRNGLDAIACALRALVEFDEELFTEQAVTGQRRKLPEAALDSLELKAAFSSSSYNRAAASYVCNLCTQAVTGRERLGDLGDSAIGISVEFPVRCAAFQAVQADDLAALHLEESPSDSD